MGCGCGNALDGRKLFGNKEGDLAHILAFNGNGKIKAARHKRNRFYLGEIANALGNRIEAFIKDIKSKEANKKEYSAVNIHDQDIYFKAKNEGITQGSQQAKIETAKNMLKDNLDIQTIIKYTGLSIDEIKNLAK